MHAAVCCASENKKREPHAANQAQVSMHREPLDLCINSEMSFGVHLLLTSEKDAQ